MEYKPPVSTTKITPRLIIHGGAGNISPANLPGDKYAAYRDALLTIVTTTSAYMQTPTKSSTTKPTALEIATFAVTQLENNPLFNAGHGAVFTRDGTNELESSVMVSRGHAKRGVGVMGLRHVKNPILLAKALLEHGDVDLGAAGHPTVLSSDGPDVPSAQGHTQIHGAAAESLARQYGLEMVEPGYFFTQKRWDEHVRALEREKEGKGFGTWSAEEYLPQGTVGAIALDEEGVVCCATSTGGLTNKLTGRIGDTPCVGAGFWAEEWVEEGDPTRPSRQQQQREMGVWQKMINYSKQSGPMVSFTDSLKGVLADCLPTPFTYTPVHSGGGSRTWTTRSIAVSGTGNGDSFLRVAAARTTGAIARFARVSGAVALSRVSGPNGELQKSASSRWGRTGEGEGGLIGIECVVVRDDSGRCVETRSKILQDFNCNGMFRAWVDDAGQVQVRVWREEQEKNYNS